MFHQIFVVYFRSPVRPLPSPLTTPIQPNTPSIRQPPVPRVRSRPQAQPQQPPPTYQQSRIPQRNSLSRLHNQQMIHGLNNTISGASSSTDVSLNRLEEEEEENSVDEEVSEEQRVGDEQQQNQHQQDQGGIEVDGRLRALLNLLNASR